MFVAATCTDQPPVTPKSPLAPGHARLSIRPAFARQAPGTPLVVLSSIRGVLIGPTGDSITVEARFEGDSAILVFDVPVTGASANYTLELTGFDGNHQEAYHATQQYTLRPGENSVPEPSLVYSAPDSKLANLHVAPGSATLNSGALATFSVNGTNAANQPISPILVAWSAKDASIATVDGNGVVHAGANQGSTYIIAHSVTNLADSALVRVHAPVGRVVVAPASLSLTRGATGAAAAELRDAGGHLIDDRTATWSSSDPSVATVSSSGVVTAVAIGTATITASAEGQNGTVALRVISPVDHIELTPNALTFASFGETQTISARLVAVAGASVAGIATSFSSSGSAASVDASGVVTARADGSATITVSADGIQATASATVRQTAATLSVSPGSAGASAIGDSRTFTAAAADARGNPMTTGITWSSSDAGIATVDANGTVTARGNGTATITATSGPKSASASFTVAQIPAALALSAPTRTLQVGVATQITGRVVDGNGNLIPGQTVSYSSTTPATASVSGSSVMGVSPGLAVIAGTAGRIQNTITFTITGIIGGPPSSGGVTGTVINGQTGLGIAGATVAGPSSNTTTASDGTFSLSNVTGGANLAISASGFVSTTYFNVPASSNGVASLGSLPLAPTSAQTGSFSGRIVDAVTGLNIPNATLTARAGINNTTGTILQQTSSDQNGNYSGSLAAGTYTILATASGYANATGTVPSIGGSSISNQNIVMSPAGLSGTQFRFILQWDANPRDLDSHLVGPAGNGQTFEVAYYSRTFSQNGTTIAQLDQDVTSGFGPETITLNQTIPGHYRYYVHIFCCGSSFGGARLTVMRGSQVAGQFTAPATTGSVWTVLELDGTTGGITSINTVSSSYNIPGAGSPSFNRLPGSGGEQDDVAALLERVKAHPKPAASRPRRPDPDTY